MKCITEEEFSSFKGILILAEVRDGKLLECTRELVSEARRLADSLKTELIGLLVGTNVSEFAYILGGYGADRVIVCEDRLLNDYTAESYAKVVCQVVETLKPEIFLISATNIGRGLAPRCAARLKTGLNADCTLLHSDDYQYREYLEKNSLLKPNQIDEACRFHGLKMTMPAFGGHMMATICCPEYRPQMATVRPGVMAVSDFNRRKAEACVIENLQFELEDSDIMSQVLETVKTIKNTTDITKADVVVTVGMGIRKDSERGVELAQQLADIFGGVIGCTRDVMNKGWLPEDCMIGQTGKIVRPKLYIALGVSGAIQHQGGMNKSGFIVAVNNDKNAPIVDIADVVLNGDLFDIVPAMIKAIEKR